MSLPDEAHMLHTSPRPFLVYPYRCECHLISCQLQMSPNNIVILGDLPSFSIPDVPNSMLIVFSYCLANRSDGSRLVREGEGS